MKLYFLGLFLIVFACSEQPNQEEMPFTFPPEWDVHEAMWSDFSTENPVIPNQNAKADIIAELTKYIKTKVVFDSDSVKELAISLLKERNANMDSIEFIKTSSEMPWVRDPGPVFVSNQKTLKSLDFGWSCYGYIYDCNEDFRGEIDNELANKMELEIETIDLNIEMGGIEVSNNTILAYKAMANQRNPEKSIEEVEDILLSALGKEQIIWLDEFPLIDLPHNKITNYFGQGANGHIDVTTRFLNDSTILATVVSEEDKDKSPLLAKDYEILQSNLRQLKAAKQPNGKPYSIVTVNAPDYSLYEYKYHMTESFFNYIPEHVQENYAIGDSIKYIPALEYANFTITNGVVLVSKYWKEGMPQSEKRKDEAIQRILKEYYPKRDIIAIDVLPINWGGGGIHCRTKHQPKVTG